MLPINKLFYYAKQVGRSCKCLKRLGCEKFGVGVAT
jgi:hypothetical protein